MESLSYLKELVVFFLFTYVWEQHFFFFGNYFWKLLQSNVTFNGILYFCTSLKCPTKAAKLPFKDAKGFTYDAWLIMVIELNGLQFGLKSYAWFQISYWCSAEPVSNSIHLQFIFNSKLRVLEIKICKICHMILFVFHFPAIWLVTLNKPWNLIGCFVFSVASSLAGKKIQFKAKNGAICE